MIGQLDEVEDIVNKQYKNLNILNLYLFGSRLYNCHHKDSDFDLILITNSKEIFLSTNAIETEKYNINIFELHYFIFLIQENIVWAQMCCWIPKEFIWKETISLNRFVMLDKKKLSNYTILDVSHCLVKSRKLIESDQKHIGLKNLVHCFREVLFSLEILTQGKISNFQIANEYFERIMKQKDKNWIFIHEKFYPQLHEFMTNLKNFRVISEKEENSFLKDYLKNNEIKCLTRDFSVCVSSIDDDLIYVGVIEKSLVDFKLPLVKECEYGVIFNSNNNIFSRFVRQNNEKSFKAIDIFEKYDGINTMLFWKNEKWNLVFKDQFKPKFYRKLATNKIQDNYLRDEKILNHQKLSDEFWKTFEEKNLKFPPKEYSYNFEFCVKNLKTCQYNQNQIILIGVYSIQKNKFENFIHFGKTLNFDLPKKLNINYKDINDELINLDPTKQEGFVSMNENFEFQFHKSFQFETLKKLEHWKALDDNTLTRLIFDIIRTNESETYLEFYPWNDQHLKLIHENSKKRYFKCLKILDEISIPLMKLSKIELTEACKQYPFYYIIFEKLKSNLSSQKILQIQTQKRFQKILKEIEIDK